MPREYDGPPLDDNIRADALGVLSDLSDWRLEPVKWKQVAAAVAHLATGVAAGDSAEVKSATIKLELLSPLRTHRAGDMDEPPEKAILDDVVRLIHTLGGNSGNGAGKAADGADPDKRE